MTLTKGNPKKIPECLQANLPGKKWRVVKSLPPADKDRRTVDKNGSASVAVAPDMLGNKPGRREGIIVDKNDDVAKCVRHPEVTGRTRALVSGRYTAERITG